MKKAVKGLVIAASVASVIGIGAVSFAAWEGSGSTSVDVTGNTTGTVSVIGFDKDATVGKVESLMPWDQGDGTVVAHYTLPEVTSGTEDYKITVTVTKADGWDGALYVIIDDTASTAASDPTAEGSAWKTIDGTASVFEFDATGDTAKQLYAHVILDSDKSADMNKSYDLTFTLAAQE
ncbi:MAG: hypothetical protein K2M48_00205 [Clostridiales bacterium]|nr:hypothetical protein [Clostridiales bacterium]